MLKEKIEELEQTRLIICGWIRDQMALIGTDIELDEDEDNSFVFDGNNGFAITKLLVNGNVIAENRDGYSERNLDEFDTLIISEIEKYLTEMVEHEIAVVEREEEERFFGESLRTSDVSVTITNNPLLNNTTYGLLNQDLAGLDKTFDCKMSVEEQKVLVDEFVKIMDNPTLTLDNLDKAEQRYNEYLETRHESKGYGNKSLCEASCIEHVGEVIKVSVRDKTVSNSKTFKCNYCQTAIDEHIERGFEVTVNTRFEI